MRRAPPYSVILSFRFFSVPRFSMPCETSINPVEQNNVLRGKTQEGAISEQQTWAPQAPKSKIRCSSEYYLCMTSRCTSFNRQYTPICPLVTSYCCCACNLEIYFYFFPNIRRHAHSLNHAASDLVLLIQHQYTDCISCMSP